MTKFQVAVLISGNGSNLQALIDAAALSDYPAEIALVISNRPDAFGIERAQKAGIRTAVIDHKKYETRSEFENALQSELTKQPIDLICLAGFMRILNPEFVELWRDRMINIHPSLLPAYKGLNTFQRAIDDGVRFAGCTIHYVVPEMDAGPIIMQAVVPIGQNDTKETLAKKIQQQEHKMYPAALKKIANGSVCVRDDKVTYESVDLGDDAVISPIL
ncbi:phosphoribosylglycinamide formyltransferase [Kordiimonas sp. SCSIO 12610]|uniref:phosphoribosylglycinamide formyltransferase n=1 Tax=Kordiimonas sp. SCSIO 12610 TaxID=2829597 RepID=UPI00210951AD|nr:phosphoribosylglycinamide formyltransferase [Kordiimonas sp. SCSIO 12610]UTW53885.1 phosphoribosylglycinamide formyltransferase [Kordiimonas sp. SCSIO 12610]